TRIAQFTELVATAIANTDSRAELAASEARAHALVREQAGLRRVATLVAKAAPADAVFAAGGHEGPHAARGGLGAGCPDVGAEMVVLSSVGVPDFPPGSRWGLDVPSLPASIRATGGPVRIDDFSDAEGLDALARDAGVRAAVGVPILVEAIVWGSISTA